MAMDGPDARVGASIVDWWLEAGVDCMVDDAPRDWLAPVRPSFPNAPASPADAAAPAHPSPAPAAPVLPATLDDFRAWLKTSGDIPGPAACRLDAAGDPASGTMIVVDMPEQGDHEERRLVTGPAGDLLDRMLPPAGLSREAIYLAPLSPARPASGRLDAAACRTLAPLMRHHIALVRPRRLLMMGDAVVRALLDRGCTDARGAVHSLSVDGLDIPVVASFHPRFLVQTPARKAAAWADLKLFMTLL